MMRVPPHWTTEQALLFTDFLGQVVDAICNEHHDSLVGLIVDHGRTNGGCICRVCRPYGPDEDEDRCDPADGEDLEDDIPF